MLNGVLIVDKPAGMTSHDVVDRIRRVARMRRVGHTGTLDPMATGVLSLCLGKATKIAQFLQTEDKEYRVEMRLGIVTDSQDMTGQVLEERPVEAFSIEAIQAVFEKFTGAQQQVPPMISAKHHQGRRLYELARQGVEVERKPQDINIWSLELIEASAPLVRFRVHCSKGTYIRTLCHDLGRELGPGAAMSGLVRSRCGSFTLADAIELDRLTDRQQVVDNLRELNEALSGYPAVTLQTAAVRTALNGQAVDCGQVRSCSAPFGLEDLVCLYSAEGTLLAMARALMTSEALQRMPAGLPALQPAKVLVEPNQLQTAPSGPIAMLKGKEVK